jgi:dienelactone hydrolase
MHEPAFVRIARLLVVALALAPLAPAAATEAPPPSADAPERQIVLRTSDGVKVYAWYRGNASSLATIVLFHQAGSSHHEYDQIAPRLNALRFATLAVDQRAGGPLFGPNLTQRELGRDVPYQDALPDLLAAIAWAHRNAPKHLIVWGSSYSASLVFAAAAQSRDVSALLAFSPDEYFDDKHYVRHAAVRVTVPIFVDSASDPNEIRGAAAIATASPSKHKTVYVPKHGVHGSSTLLESRNPQGALENWLAVETFLARNNAAR